MKDRFFILIMCLISTIWFLMLSLMAIGNDACGPVATLAFVFYSLVIMYRIVDTIEDDLWEERCDFTRVWQYKTKSDAWQASSCYGTFSKEETVLTDELFDLLIDMNDNEIKFLRSIKEEGTNV